MRRGFEALVKWLAVLAILCWIATIFATIALGQPPGPSPYGNAFGPHEVTYPCPGPVPPGCPGLHWVPGEGPSSAPQVFTTDPFQVMLGFRSTYSRPPSTRYQGLGGTLPDYAYNAFAARVAEIEIGCNDYFSGNGRGGCLYPRAWWSFEFVEPPVQAILREIAVVLAADPGFQTNCVETEAEWNAALHGTPYFGPQVCPTGASPTPTPTPCPTGPFGGPQCTTSTPTPTQTPCPTGPFGQPECATPTPTVSSTPARSSTPTATPSPTSTPTPSSLCQPSSTALCLQGRFKVSVTFGGVTQATATPLAATDGGYFWFYQPSNPEVFVKVLNGCSSGGNWWVFAAGLTNVQTAIRVEDTKTMEFNIYAQPPGKAFVAIQDAAAFPCQP